MIEFPPKGRQRGQSIIEFAVIVPFFLMFMLSVIYGGMMISDYLALKHVAGTAARVATLSGNNVELGANEDVLKDNTALLVCKGLTLTPSIVKDSSGEDTDFIYYTASATVKIPIVKQYFTDELKATSAPEYKGSN